MAVSLSAIREGLAANLASLDGINVSAYFLANATPPALHIYPGGPTDAINYDLAFGRGLDKWTFTVQAFVTLGTDLSAQKNLDAFIAPSGPQSVKEQIESDDTLGGLVDNVNVTFCTGYRVYPRANGDVLGAEWTVEVMASGQ